MVLSGSWLSKTEGQTKEKTYAVDKTVMPKGMAVFCEIKDVLNSELLSVILNSFSSTII